MEAGARDPSGASRKGPDIVVTKKAFQMAQAWVKNMTGGADVEPEENDDDSPSTEAFGVQRPARLGLGAKYLPHSQASAIMTPVEKKLRAKLNAARQGGDHGAFPSAVSRKEKTTPTAEVDHDQDDERNEGVDSKTSTFGRKQRNTQANLLRPISKAGKRKRV